MGTESLFITKSFNHQFNEVMEESKGIAVTKNSYLISGFSGSGKKSLAKYIHELSSRKNESFYVLDCKENAQNVKNKVLGYRDEEGAFHKGLLERGDKGTVVFSNIDALEISFQEKLVDILCDLEEFDLDVRLVATSTKDLTKCINAGNFNRKLYHVFSKIQVNLPSLRERKEDIAFIADYYLQELCNENNVCKKFSPEVVAQMQDFYWEGNINELKSLVNKAFESTRENVINNVDFIDQGNQSLPEDIEEKNLIRLMSLREAEKILVQKALVHTEENRTKAAKILGVSIRTLRNKINEYRSEGLSYFVNLR